MSAIHPVHTFSLIEWPLAGTSVSHGRISSFTRRLDHLCFLCLMFLMLSRLFIAAVWSPAGKGLNAWLLLVMFTVFLLLSHVISWVRIIS